jgi:hypothetical protein
VECTQIQFGHRYLLLERLGVKMGAPRALCGSGKSRRSSVVPYRKGGTAGAACLCYAHTVPHFDRASASFVNQLGQSLPESAANLQAKVSHKYAIHYGMP